MFITIVTSAPGFWEPQAMALAGALARKGHEAVVVTPRSLDRMRGRCADLLFCLGTGESLLSFLGTLQYRRSILYLIESIPTPTEEDAFTRLKLDVHRPYLRAFDHIFVHTRRSIPMLQALGARRVQELIWPHFPGIFAPVPGQARDIDVLFLGTMSPHRQEVLALAGSRRAVSVHNGIYHQDCARLHARARIVLNIHFTPLPNLECRILEALGCGAFVLTEPLDPADVFVAGRHLAVFERDDLPDKIDYYLGYDAEREAIARQGHEEVGRFDIDRQAERVLEVTGALLQSPPLGPGANARQVNVTIAGKPYSIAFPPWDAPDFVVQEIFVKKIYPYLEFLRTRSGTILDVGANVGCCSVWFRALYPNLPIHAFEPDANTCLYLQANSAALEQVTVHNFGLYDRDCTTTLYEGSASSTTHSIAASIHNTGRGQQVRLRRISSFLQENRLERIVILKLDTEGAEVPILRDLEPWLDRIDAVYLEYHSEEDRLEIDRLLTGAFLLFSAHVSLAHRGNLVYVARKIVENDTNLSKLRIARPNL